MYISDIKETRHYVGRGLTFDNLEQVASAIQCLGALRQQNAQRVDGLVRTMRESLVLNTVHSGPGKVPMGRPSAGIVSNYYTSVTGTALLDNDFVIGKRFFVHNDNGLRRYEPFPDLEIQVSTLVPVEGDGPERYQLTVTDLSRSSKTKVPQNHTETKLAAELGNIRPIDNVMVYVEYCQEGPEVTFDTIPALLKALKSIDGFNIKITAEELAQIYYDLNRDPTTENLERRPTLRHASGAQLLICGFNGIKTHSETMDHRQLVTLKGNVISGPLLDPRYPPNITFRIDRGVDNTPSEELVSLAEALTDALWSLNYN